MRIPSPLIPATLCLALLASACGGDDTTAPRLDELESRVSASAEREDELLRRVDELESLLAADDTDGEDPLGKVRARIVTLEEDLSALMKSTATGDDERAAELEKLAGDIVRLDQKLGQVQASMTGLTERLDLLTDELSSLEAQFKAHSHD